MEIGSTGRVLLREEKMAAPATVRPKGFTVLGIVLIVFALGTIAFWIVFFISGAVSASDRPAYLEHEKSFPLADFYMALMCGRRLEFDDLKFLWHGHWKHQTENREDILWKNDSTFESLKTDGTKLLEAFSRFFVPEDAAVIAVEEAFTFQIPGIPVPIIGAYDLVLEDSSGLVTIVDHKTLSRTSSKKEMDGSLQGTIYNMAAKANGFASRNIRLRFDLLIKTKEPRYERHVTTRNDSDEKRAIRKIQAVWDGISKGVFIPNDSSFRCECCGFKAFCNAWPDEKD